MIERAMAPAPAVGPGRLAYWLSTVLAAVTAAAAFLTYEYPDLLRGAAVMKGSARGTALAMVLIGLPILGCSMALVARGAGAAVVAWLGAVGFLLYNSLMLVFATPANRLFPLYLATLALSAWSARTLPVQANRAAPGELHAPRTPVRAIAVYLWVIIAVNAVARLTRVIPAAITGGRAAYLDGTGLTTNIVDVPC